MPYLKGIAPRPSRVRDLRRAVAAACLLAASCRVALLACLVLRVLLDMATPDQESR